MKIFTEIFYIFKEKSSHQSIKLQHLNLTVELQPPPLLMSENGMTSFLLFLSLPPFLIGILINKKDKVYPERRPVFSYSKSVFVVQMLPTGYCVVDIISSQRDSRGHWSLSDLSSTQSHSVCQTVQPRPIVNQIQHFVSPHLLVSQWCLYRN